MYMYSSKLNLFRSGMLFVGNYSLTIPGCNENFACFPKNSLNQSFRCRTLYITNKFSQSLGTSLNWGSTVLTCTCTQCMWVQHPSNHFYLLQKLELLTNCQNPKHLKYFSNVLIVLWPMAEKIRTFEPSTKPQTNNGCCVCLSFPHAWLALFMQQ